MNFTPRFMNVRPIGYHRGRWWASLKAIEVKIREKVMGEADRVQATYGSLE